MIKQKSKVLLSIVFIISLIVSGCSTGSSTGSSSSDTGSGTKKNDDGKITIGVAFETLQTAYWVASFETMKEELEANNIEMVEAIADGDANRQYEQVKNFITRGVDGIIVVPKDGKTVIPMIKEANNADIPIVVYNRPPDPNDAKSVTVVADNKTITKSTVEYMVEQAKAKGGKHKATILVGSLGDQNGIDRRDGFKEVVAQYPDLIEVVAEVPTEWNQEKALAGVQNALQANPDIDFIFTSSDFLFPSLIQALKAEDKWHKIGEEGHVILGGFDGDDGAYELLKDGYLDATGVQDMYFESEQALQAILDMIEGKEVSEKILDPGFAIHQGNLAEEEERMWGAQVYKQNNQ